MLAKPEYSDELIADLIAEPKWLAENPVVPCLRPDQTSQQRRWKVHVRGRAGSRFMLIVRQLCLNQLDFSVILVHLPEHRSGEFNLTRYNGDHGEHTNDLEGTKLTGMHIHKATERYQLHPGYRDEHFAEPTERYADLRGAIDCALEDCGFELPARSQLTFDLLEVGQYDCSD
jgi:hypothetical protein